MTQQKIETLEWDSDWIQLVLATNNAALRIFALSSIIECDIKSLTTQLFSCNRAYLGSDDSASVAIASNFSSEQFRIGKAIYNVLDRKALFVISKCLNKEIKILCSVCWKYMFKAPTKPITSVALKEL